MITGLKKGKEKEDMAIDDILTLFNEISIECGKLIQEISKKCKEKRRTYDGKENRTVSQSKF